MKQTLLFFVLMIGLASCTEKFNEDVLTIAGVYEATVVGVDGPFAVTISIDHDKDIIIDAPFDGNSWFLVEAKVKNE